MDRDSRKLLARIKAYKLEGLTHRQIAKKLGVTPNTVAGLVYRDRHGLAIGRPTLQRDPTPYVERFKGGHDTPEQRPNDCFKHLELIAKANNGKGFPFLNLPPTYRVAA